MNHLHTSVEDYMTTNPDIVVLLFWQMFVSTATVGSIVGLQSAEIQQMASEYEEKVCTQQGIA